LARVVKRPHLPGRTHRHGPQRRGGHGQRPSQRRVLAALPRPADHRRNVITITPAGAARLERLDELLAGVQEDLLAPLSPGERDQRAPLLSRLLDHHSGT
jgi:DNA-binding MarR family transcriptional regulator